MEVKRRDRVKVGRASYKEALDWILHNDCPDFEDDNSGHIVTCLVADLFKVSVDKVLIDLRKRYGKIKVVNNSEVGV